MLKKYWKQCMAGVMVAILAGCSQERPTEYEGWDLVWHDEFNKDGVPDSAFWSFEEGFVRNKELQWYQAGNAVCKDGVLIIEGRKERMKNPDYDSESSSWRTNREFAEYTSASIRTRGKQEFLYGRFEMRAKIPVVSGAWPAFWTLGTQNSWPSCGEIDIMEYYRIGGEPHILANAAWGAKRGDVPEWNSAKLPYSKFTAKDIDWAGKFHIWRMDWDQEFIRLYLDDELLNEIPLSNTVNGSVGKFINPFKTPHFILLNLAMGGNGGEVNEDLLPMRYEIDYVRVYQKKQEPYTAFHPGQIWEDTEGVHINAHGGGVLYHNGTYYWYGEHKSEHTSSALVGVRVYSSTDLYNWKNEGVALPVMPEGSGHKIEKGCVIERPKVIYNEKTKKFVMWFHLELKRRGYAAAEYGVAESDTPTGPFHFLYASRSCPDVWPQNMTEAEIAKAKSFKDFNRKNGNWKQSVKDGMCVARDLKTGQMARDMTLFVDEDGKAYHIFSSEENHTLHIAELTDDYLYHTDKYVRILPAGHNEAPAVFKKDGVYWMITSGCTGWKPNAARLSKATSIWGPWESLPNPCVGEGADITFDSQSTFILPVEGKENSWIFMADRWRPKNPIDARYIWLPIIFEDEKPVLKWMDEWNLSSVTKCLSK